MAENTSDTSSPGRNGSPRKESAQDSTPTAPGNKSMASKLDPLLAKLPSWLSAAVKDPRKWKTFVRCMVCLFANLVLLVCQPSKFTFSSVQAACGANSLLYSSRSRIRRSSRILRAHRRLHPSTLCPPLGFHLPHAHRHRRHVYRLGMGRGSHGSRATSEESDIIGESVYSCAGECQPFRDQSGCAV